jgi:Ser/Thr protein kinase RdoA (MazF antagonist)
MPLANLDVRPVLRQWTGLDLASSRLVNHSENHTFFVQNSSGERFSLRVHRPGYQSVAAIESELAWLNAVRQDTDLNVPALVPGRDGMLLQPFQASDGMEHFAVLFRFVEGTEPVLDGPSEELFRVLGRYAATLHNHAIGWSRPAGFERPVWTAETILAPGGLWGDWRKGPGVGGAERAVLQRLEQVLIERLSQYGTGADRFGLIHADMRLGNLLVDANRLTLIDFDDCGLGWFTYDFAAAISFHETHPAIPALKAAWLEGYQPVRNLTAEDVVLLDAMVMLRRMALLAWIGSHGETVLAATHREGFAAGTVHLAERFMNGEMSLD